VVREGLGEMLCDAGHWPPSPFQPHRPVGSCRPILDLLVRERGPPGREVLVRMLCVWAFLGLRIYSDLEVISKMK